MKLPKPDPSNSQHRQRASRWRKRPLGAAERAWLDEYDAACAPAKRTARQAFGGKPAALPEITSSSMGVSYDAPIAEPPLEVRTSPPPSAPPPPPAPAPVLEPDAPPLDAIAPAAAGSALSADVLAARAAALASIYGMAADGFEELHGAIEQTMQRQWILPRTYWREAWLPLIVAVTNRYLPDWVSGPIIDGVAVGMPPVALMRAARSLEKAGYRLGEPGEPGRAVATSAKVSPTPAPTETRSPAPPPAPGGKIDPRDMFKGAA